MPKVSASQESFTAGELSPLMWGRVTLDVYKAALRRCFNSITLVQGPVTRRSGTYWVDEVRYSSKATRIIRFKYSTVQAYPIEFGDLYVRFKKDNGPVLEFGFEPTLTITGITRAAPGVLTYTGTDPTNGDTVVLSGITGMREVEGRTFLVTNVNAGANTFELGTVDTTDYQAYASGGIVTQIRIITGITKANPAVVTFRGPDPVNTQTVYISGVVGMTEVNDLSFTVAGLSGKTFQLSGVNSTAYTTYVSGGTAPTACMISAITKASPGVVTYVGNDPANGDMLDISGIVGMTELNGRRVTVASVNTGANTFTLTDQAGNINTTAFTTWASGGVMRRVYTVTTPFVEADLFELKFTQSADVLYITHPDYTPRKLSRTSDTSWSLTEVKFLDGPYGTLNATATTLTPGAATGNAVTMTASSVVGINDGAGFKTTDVGRLIRLKQGTVWGYCRITVWTSTTVVTVDIISTLTSAAAKAFWRMGLYSGTTGYPSTCTFHEDRLGFAGSALEPERGDLSKSSDYENFAPTDTDGTVTDSAAIPFALRSDDVQVIRWMKSDEKGLLVGTVEGEWGVRPSLQNEALSPTNRKASQARSHGSTNTTAIRTGTGLVFIQKSGRKVREVAYDFYEDKFKTPDVTIMAQHITQGGLKELTYQQDPQSIVWAAKNTGSDHEFVGLTYERDQKVLGWHRHALGGWSDADQTVAPLVESVAAVPSATGARDDVWLVVQRYLNGRTVRSNEYITKIWEQDVDAQEDAFFVDAGLTYDGELTTTLSGLHHLSGATVQVLADGSTHVDVVVSATGGVTLTRGVHVAQVGYAYHSEGQTLRMDVGAADGTAQGKTQRTHRCIFRVHDSLGLQVGSNFNASGPGKLVRPAMRTSGDDTAEAVPLFTGDIEVSWEGDYTTENTICWRWDQPLPGTIMGIYPQLHTQDR